ncbi:PREDICTED: uncharacterized protein LOC109213197 [Nicotiana attenuata]|uniref:uncharacterized protein LOC109213197 n=1 Tax=Nicotiana attenuata TaxID=49451 RepID=UPI000905127B|nr:PREDICTED: uncharacterized protein LOC109213197 [Nicotiana attenuata]
MAEEAVRFFKAQFHEETVPSSFDIIDHIPNLIDSVQNLELIKQPSKDEVKNAVMGLNGESAGGPDGFIGSFFHSCWEIIGDDIVEMVKAFFSGHELPRFITHTNLVLLPKKKEVVSFSDMRPISLSNFVNKIFSRVVHERIAGLLPNLISEEQAGFVKGRSIVENVLLTQEIITDKRLRTKAGPNVVIKLDMAKAYDRLSWLFLTKVLRKMGFGERFIGVIYGIVANNWYSVLLNRQPFGFFKSTRGVKQGDPLSPTLFILAAEALSRGLNSLHRNLHCCGFGLPKWSPKNNHLAYADDTIIFSSSDATSLSLIMRILTAYESASGQLINKSKSAIYMHHSAGEEVVNQSMPIHLLSSVNPPSYVINKLHKIFAQFFWGNTVGEANRHWASWSTLCLPCEEGGVGFRSLHDVSTALFCKLWWNFRTKPSLWSSFMSQKYCQKLNPIIVPWRDGSHVWRKMLECRELVEHQIMWQPKMGSSLFWFENWTGLGALYFVTPPNFVVDESIQNIYDVVDNGQWDEGKIREALPEDLADHIIWQLKPPVVHEVLDKPHWMLETKGEFSVKSAWEYLRRRNEPCNAYKKIWVKAVRVWKYFLGHAGINMEGISFHQAITKCWTTEVVPRLQPIIQALPAVIVWELWKRRNSYKHGEAVTVDRVIYQISTTMQSLVQLRKPSLQQVPHRWPELLHMLESYLPKLSFTKVLWECPKAGWIKVNTDGASRGNPGRSSIGFVLRNEEGDLIYGCGKEIQEGTNTEAEAKAILEALKFCVLHDYVLIELHTDSMMLRNVLNGEWKIPWGIVQQVEEIKELLTKANVSVAHTLREGNKLADHLANYALDFGDIEAQEFWELDIQGRRIVNDDKSQCPYLRVKVARR